jgi:hypothetical protein
MGPKPAQLFSKARTSAASKAPLASSAGQPPSSSLSFGRPPDLDHDHPDNQHPGAAPSGGSSAAAFSNIQMHASTPRLSTVDAPFLRTTTTSSSPGGHTDGPLRKWLPRLYRRSSAHNFIQGCAAFHLPAWSPSYHAHMRALALAHAQAPTPAPFFGPCSTLPSVLDLLLAHLAAAARLDPRPPSDHGRLPTQ